MENVTKGAEERRRIEDKVERNYNWKTREEMTFRPEERQRRHLDEGHLPILDWDYIFRVHIPSVLRYKALFPTTHITELR